MIELITTVAILAILAAILIPALQQANAKAQRMKCLSNTRQLQVAVAQFVGKHNEYPLYRNPGFRNGLNESHHVYWKNAIAIEGLGVAKSNSFQFNMSKGVWDCPAAKRPENLPANAGFPEYGYNAWGMGTSSDSLGLSGNAPAGNDKTRLAPVQEGEVTSPSTMIAIGDGFQGNDETIRDAVSAIGRSATVEDYYNSTQRAIQRHHERANVAFCDGHAETRTLDQLFKASTADALTQWNRDNQAHRERVP